MTTALPSQRKRIVRRAVMALAACVLLLSSYISCWGAWRWLQGRNAPTLPFGGPTSSQTQWADPAFAPIRSYAHSHWPGHRTVRIFGEWCYYHGNGAGDTWSQLDETVQH
jgi:hypothetical protein